MYGTFETPNKEYLLTIDKSSLNPLGVVMILTVYKFNSQTKTYEAVIKMPLKPFSK